MPAGSFDFSDDYAQRQGDTWTWTFRVKTDSTTGRNLTGYTPKMQIRKKPDGDILLTFDVVTNPLITGIVVANQASPSTAGLLTFRASSADTALIKSGEWVYDVQLADTASPPFIETFLAGAFVVVEQVTE